MFSPSCRIHGDAARRRCNLCQVSLRASGLPPRLLEPPGCWSHNMMYLQTGDLLKVRLGPWGRKEDQLRCLASPLPGGAWHFVLCGNWLPGYRLPGYWLPGYWLLVTGSILSHWWNVTGVLASYWLPGYWLPGFWLWTQLPPAALQS